MLRDNTRALRIVPFIIWLGILAFALTGHTTACYALSPLLALYCCLLILHSRRTQGHYLQISMAYAAGIGLWCVAAAAEYIAMVALPDSSMAQAVCDNLFLAPNAFFAVGLMLFAYNEYNLPHFQRMLLHTFAMAYVAFLIAQKLILVYWVGERTEQLSIMITGLYFFVVVFNIVLVLNIFAQTGFKGHTPATNLSAVALVNFNLIELRMIYFRAVGRDPANIYLRALGLLGVVIYAYAQSDPALIHRQPEPDELVKGRSAKKSGAVWINAAVCLIGGLALYEVNFFDIRDLYLLIIATLAYVVVYKTIQANKLSAMLLEREREEKVRLEGLVEEKTRELREMNDYLEQISITDALTGLRNRRYGMRRLHQLAEAAGERPFSIMLMDLNNFKPINDNYGHDAGDRVLQEIGRRLADCGGASVTVTRLGGDEFLMIVEGESGVTAMAERVCALIDRPTEHDGVSLRVSACIGIARCPQDTRDVNELYRYADSAMYTIKHQFASSRYRYWSRSLLTARLPG